ncbi:MAG TPA: Grx4 family monothiol glutaredoxin [Burkholderiales bacterium]
MASTAVDIRERIKQQIASDRIFLYMKGTPEAPMCGFSAQVVKILNALGAKYSTFDVLSDNDIRQGVKEYSNWPTFPQLYVNGELVGGCDIVTELYQRGELKSLLEKAQQ